MSKEYVILELRKNCAVAINDQCEFIKIKRTEDMFLGQVIERNFNNTRPGIIYGIASIAALFLIVLGGFMFVNNSMDREVYAYVDIDINPSLEFVINKNNKVLDLVPLNSDGDKIIKGESLKGKDFREAALVILSRVKNDGYLTKGEGNFVLLTASYVVNSNLSEDENNEIFTSFNDTINKVKNDIESNEGINTSTKVMYVSSDIRKPSMENNMSMGRFTLYSKAKEKGIEITPQDAIDTNIKELVSYVYGENMEALNDVSTNANKYKESIMNNKSKNEDKVANTSSKPSKTPTVSKHALNDKINQSMNDGFEPLKDHDSKDVNSLPGNGSQHASGNNEVRPPHILNDNNKGMEREEGDKVLIPPFMDDKHGIEDDINGLPGNEGLPNGQHEQKGPPFIPGDKPLDVHESGPLHTNDKVSDPPITAPDPITRPDPKSVPTPTPTSTPTPEVTSNTGAESTPTPMGNKGPGATSDPKTPPFGPPKPEDRFPPGGNQDPDNEFDGKHGPIEGGEEGLPKRERGRWGKPDEDQFQTPPIKYPQLPGATGGHKGGPPF